MANVVPALISDLQRPWLWKGSVVGALLVLGILGLFIAAAVLDPGAPTQGLDLLLLEPALSLVLTAGALVGSFSFTSDYRDGCLNRRVLLFQRGPAFTARAAATAVSALLGGATIGLVFGISGILLDDGWQPSLAAILAFAGAACMGSLWGFAIGSLIRNHLVSLFAVPLSLILPEFMSGPLGETKRFVFPVLVTEWAGQLAIHIPARITFFGAATWLVIVTAVAFGVFLKRDLV